MLKDNKFFIIISTVVLLFIMSFSGLTNASTSLFGRIVIANKNDGTLSVISTESNTVIDTIALPVAAKQPEPMYVVHVPVAHRVFVGDRANDRVIVFSDNDLHVEGEVKVGAGVFHMWSNYVGTQLWVTGDIDKTLTVINPMTLHTHTFPIPKDIIEKGGKPHDVIVDDVPFPGAAYVSFVGLPGEHDAVVKYNALSHKEVARASVAKDPHLALNLISNKLYVASQKGNLLYTIKRSNMKIKDSLTIPGAHGVSLFPVGMNLYVTDITADQGMHALYQYNIEKNKITGSPITTEHSVSHNIAQDGFGQQLYITHSGANSRVVSHYKTNFLTGNPEKVGDIVVGHNPFGLAYIY